MSDGIEITIGEPSAEHEDGVWFAPDFGNNLDLPEDKRAAVCITPMSAREMQKLNQANLIKTKSQKMPDVVASVARREAAKREKVLRERVVGVRNFWTKDRATGERKSIGTPAELIDSILSSRNAALLSVLDSIYEAITDESSLQEGLIKN